MSAGDEIRKDYQSSASVYNLGIQNRQVSSSDAQALASWLTEKKPPAKPTAHRASVSSADTGDISSATGALDVGNSNYVAGYVDFSVASASASILLALFDASGDLLGITEVANLQADASLRDGSSGPYVAPRYVFDVSGASQVRALVQAISSGNINIFLMAL